MTSLFRMQRVALFARIPRPDSVVGRYTSIPHAHISHGNTDGKHHYPKSRSLGWYRADGLSSIRYDLHRRALKPLYTWILASVDRKLTDETRDQLLVEFETLDPIYSRIANDKKAVVRLSKDQKRTQRIANLIKAAALPFVPRRAKKKLKTKQLKKPTKSSTIRNLSTVVRKSFNFTTAEIAPKNVTLR